MLVENLMEESLIGQRIVYDGIQKAGGVFSVNIDKNMIHFCTSCTSTMGGDITKK